MRLFLFLAVGFIPPSFSSEKLYSAKKIQDISFQVIRENYSLERLSADYRMDLTGRSLFHLLTDESNALNKALSNGSGFPEPKKDLFYFLLMGETLQKKALKMSSQLLEKWIDKEIRAEDLSYFKIYDSELEEIIGDLGPKETLVSMPHFFLSLADAEIIESVFAARGFNPRYQTSLGNNLIHSFLLAAWMKRVLKQEIEEGSYKQALQLLIEKSPPELLTQKNDMSLTPIALSVYLYDTIAYELLMKFMPAKDIAREIPVLEREILNRGLYALFNPLSEFRVHSGLGGPFLLIGERGEVFIELKDEINPMEKGFFKSLSAPPSLVKFNFQSLIPQGRSIDFVKNSLNEFQKYEYARIQQIGKIFHDPDLEELKELLTAIFKRNLPAFHKALRRIKLQSRYENTDVAQIILEESIRSQFEGGVLTSIHIMKNSKIPHYDPVFLSLLSYVSLPELSPDKEQAKKIIRLAASAKSKEEDLSASSVFWSIFFGLAEEVDYFIKEQGILAEPELIVYGMEYAAQEGYIPVFNSLRASLKDHPAIISSSCKDIFLH